MTTSSSSVPRETTTDVYQRLATRYSKENDPLTEDCATIDKTRRTIDIHYEDIQSARVKAESYDVLVEKRDGYYRIFVRLQESVKKSISFEKDLRSGVSFLDTPPMQAETLDTIQRRRPLAYDQIMQDQTKCTKQLSKLKDWLGHMTTVRVDMVERITTLGSSFKYFCAVVSNNGKPLSYYQLGRTRVSLPPNLDKEINEQGKGKGKIVETEEGGDVFVDLETEKERKVRHLDDEAEVEVDKSTLGEPKIGMTKSPSGKDAASNKGNKAASEPRGAKSLEVDKSTQIEKETGVDKSKSPLGKVSTSKGDKAASTASEQETDESTQEEEEITVEKPKSTSTRDSSRSKRTKSRQETQETDSSSRKGGKAKATEDGSKATATKQGTPTGKKKDKVIEQETSSEESSTLTKSTSTEIFEEV